MTDNLSGLPGRPVAVLISANGEWQSVLDLLSPLQVVRLPLGEAFVSADVDENILFFHSGWGKTRSAAACQYVIDRFHPRLIINLGTCGGLEGFARVGEILLVDSTVMYDIFERMDDPQAALDYYRAQADTSWLPERLPENTFRAGIASADQDIDFRNHRLLTEEFKVPAADWESAAIAWVAKMNATAFLILRGISDLVSPSASETDANPDLWFKRTRQIMTKLLHDLPFYLAYSKNL